jgi:hypothetical protein
LSHWSSSRRAPIAIVSDDLRSAQHLYSSRGSADAYEISLHPHTWAKHIKVRVAILFVTVGAPECKGLTGESLCADEFSRLTRSRETFSLRGSCLVEDVDCHTKCLCLDFVGMQGQQCCPIDN